MLLAEFGGIGATVNVWRSPSATAGSPVGTPTQVGTAVPMLLIPASDAQQLGLLPAGLGGGRADFYGVHRGTATIRTADEVRSGTATYHVEGTASWSLAVVVALSLPA